MGNPERSDVDMTKAVSLPRVFHLPEMKFRLGLWICYLGLTTKRDIMHRWILFFCCIQNTVLTNQDHREIISEGEMSITELKVLSIWQIK